jgi:hypothetical protein
MQMMLQSLPPGLSQPSQPGFDSPALMTPTDAYSFPDPTSNVLQDFLKYISGFVSSPGSYEDLHPQFTGGGKRG